MILREHATLNKPISQIDNLHALDDRFDKNVESDFIRLRRERQEQESSLQGIMQKFMGATQAFSPYELKPNEIVVDNFAGGGGASTGMEIGLGTHVDIAINHDKSAIDMHQLNHPECEHYCESIWDVNPLSACRGRPVGYGWFSPDCRHFSVAKGNRPVLKAIRGLAWIVVRWAALVPMRVFTLENVEEFMTWGPCLLNDKGEMQPDKARSGETFKAFIKVLTTGLPADDSAWPEIYEALGEEFEHYEKLRNGLGYDIEFKSLQACDFGAPTTRTRFFMIGRNDGAAIMWPTPTHGKKGSGLLKYKSAADFIDWSLPVKSIYTRKKPLALNTLARIEKGLEKFVFNDSNPFIVPKECEVPFFDEVELPAGCTKADVLITSNILKLRNGNIGHRTDAPLHTISAGGLHFGEVRAFFVKYYGTAVGQSCSEPLDTITTKDRFALVTVKGDGYQLLDIGMRMLEPYELFLAQGFPVEYQIDISPSGKKWSKKVKVARCGNSVCPPVASAITSVNVGGRPENGYVDIEWFDKKLLA
jgi:DNA (cytosine-5)-methyltransferase 1